MEVANTSQNQQKVHKKMEQYLSNHMDPTVLEFEKLSDRYKSKYTKFSNIEEFELWLIVNK